MNVIRWNQVESLGAECGIVHCSSFPLYLSECAGRGTPFHTVSSVPVGGSQLLQSLHLGTPGV